MEGPVYLNAEIHPDSIEISSHGRSSLFSCRNYTQTPSRSDLMGGQVYLVAEIHQTPSRSDLMGGRVYLVAEIHPDSIEISSHGRVQSI